MAYIPDEAIERMHELTGGAFALYTYYCKLRSAQDGVCYPSLRTTAAEMHTRYQRVYEWRKELIAKGWIVCEKASGPKPPLVTPLKGFGTIPKGMKIAPATVTKSVTPTVTDSAPSVTPDVTPTVTDTVTATVTEKGRYCNGKREVHIRTEPAHEPAHEEISVVVAVPSVREGAAATALKVSKNLVTEEMLDEYQAKAPERDVRKSYVKCVDWYARLDGTLPTPANFAKWFANERTPRSEGKLNGTIRRLNEAPRYESASARNLRETFEYYRFRE